MLSLRMNDTAVTALGVLAGFGAAEPPGGLAPGLRELAARGIVRRGSVLTWAGSQGDAERAPAGFPDFTGWECSDSSLHLEDFVPVDATPLDSGQPLLSEGDQRLLLLHGLALAWEFHRLAQALQPPAPVRCIITANDSNGTFRFHQLRPGESWNVPDLDSYRQDKALVVDVEPAGA